MVARRFGRWGPSAFVTRFGSTFRENPTGGDVVRVSLARLGRRPTAPVQRFATGFGHQEPLGAALGPGGALYVSLWNSGRVVRLVPRRPSPPRATAAEAASPVVLLRALAELLRALFLAGSPSTITSTRPGHGASSPAIGIASVSDGAS